MDRRVVLLLAFTLIIVEFTPGCQGRVVKSSAGNDLETEDEFETLVERLEELVEKNSLDESRATTGMNTDQQMRAVQMHNDLRMSEGATGMHKLKWNQQLADLAQDWANKCVWEHRNPQSFDAKPYGFKNVGENIWAWSSDDSFKIPTKPIQDWYDEKFNYDLGSNYCYKEPCGHYTAVTWDATTDMGCGVKFCPNLANTGWKNGGIFFVCNYGPGGNENGKAPFTRGTPCTTCASGRFYCSDNLCDTECPSTGKECACKPQCNNGNLESSSCSCKCKSGYTGVTCAVKCEDVNPSCPYMKNMCNDATYGTWVKEQCPAACGLCVAKRSGNDEQEFLELLNKKIAEEKRMAEEN